MRASHRPGGTRCRIQRRGNGTKRRYQRRKRTAASGNPRLAHIATVGEPQHLAVGDVITGTADQYDALLLLRQFQRCARCFLRRRKTVGTTQARRLTIQP